MYVLAESVVKQTFQPKSFSLHKSKSAYIEPVRKCGREIESIREAFDFSRFKSVLVKSLKPAACKEESSKRKNQAIFISQSLSLSSLVHSQTFNLQPLTSTFHSQAISQVYFPSVQITHSYHASSCLILPHSFPDSSSVI